jgi:mediator of RNA polymerase II transcription subunit 16, fungi type
VILRHLVCKPADGKWTLSEEYQQSQVAQLHVGQQLVHLCWNEVGNDLAVLDVSGRISIFSISTTLNNIAINRQPMLDQPDDGAQVVGMMWMNANRAVSVSIWLTVLWHLTNSTIPRCTLFTKQPS